MVRPLSPREHEALGLLSRGLKRSAAAREMGVSFATFGSHVQAAYMKLGVDNLVDALVAAEIIQIRPECGAVMRCTRPAGHRGHHGGFRAVADDEGNGHHRRRRLAG